MLKKYTLKEHFIELKARFLKVFAVYMIAFTICYFYSTEIYQLLLKPLIETSHTTHKVIYTGLTEAFFTYLKLAAFGAFVIIIPIIALQAYLFISPALYQQEKRVAQLVFLLSPFLFWVGGIFVFFFVMPKAWHFFLSFETHDSIMPIVLEAKISEYLSLVMQLIIAFGMAFELPVILLILTLLKVISTDALIRKRRLAIVVNFIIAGIITPPDVLSQFALAIPMVLLYEISIVMCKVVENREANNVGH